MCVGKQVCVFPGGQQSIFQDWHCGWAVLGWRSGLNTNGKRPVLSWNPAFFGLCAFSLIRFTVLVSVVPVALTGNFSWILHMHSAILHIPNSVFCFLVFLPNICLFSTLIIFLASILSVLYVVLSQPCFENHSLAITLTSRNNLPLVFLAFCSRKGIIVLAISLRILIRLIFFK